MTTEAATTSERVLGIDFFNGSVADAVALTTSAPGCVMMPPSPALVKLNYDEEYRHALNNADVVLADSGLLAALWRLATGRRLSRISGLEYLWTLLEKLQDKEEAVAWLVRSEEAKLKALSFLEKTGFPTPPNAVHVVSETPGQDHSLLLAIENQKPRHVVIAVLKRQEQMGIYLREYLLHRPTIHCVGAALGFLTGDERPIPAWFQRRHLGWMARLASQPTMILPRAGIALAIAAMVLRYRSEMPTLRVRWTDL